MARAIVRVEWNPKLYLARVKFVMDKVIKEVAYQVAEDAKRNLERHTKRKIFYSEETKSTGTLASQIDVKISRFKNGGYLVKAQGTGNYQKYYASFVELGTSKMAPIPYMRPAIKRNRYRMKKKLKNELGFIVPSI